MDLLLNPEVWVAFLTLLALEIVLGIDNIVFISILVDKLPEERQALARRLGLGMALIMRILLLLSLSWVIGLTAPLFTVLGHEISGRDVVLIVGGLFLLGKSTYEIHENLAESRTSRIRCIRIVRDRVHSECSTSPATGHRHTRPRAGSREVALG